MIHDLPKDGPIPFRGEKPFRMVTIYDSAVSSADAARASALVMRELGEEITVDRSSWNIASLDNSHIHSIAANEAARADLIVIALTDGVPTTTLKHWVASWERNRKSDDGLLALIPAGKSGSQVELENFFYETAITANMEFLCRKAKRY